MSSRRRRDGNILANVESARQVFPSPPELRLLSILPLSHMFEQPVGLLLALAPGSEALLGVATLVLMLLSSYVGTVAKAAGGRRQYGGVMGKADRMIYLSLVCVVAFLLPGVPVFRYFLVAVLVGLGLTIAQRLRAAYVDLQPGR